MSSLSLVLSCLWTVTRCVLLVQLKFLTFFRAHVFTQPCSILSLNSDAMCAPSAAETSYLYKSTWFHKHSSILSLNSDTMGAPSAADTSYLYQSTSVHSALSNLVFELWHDVCPLCSRNFLPLSQHMSSPSLVQSCLWTVTRCVPLVQQKLLTFITAHEFTQPCSILSLNSDTMGAPSAADTSYLHQSTWVHSALFNLVFEQWHDVCL